jgi:hypothetical protein
MKLDKQMLVELNACSEGLAWYEEHGADSIEETIDRLITAEKYEWACWLLPRVVDRKTRILMACCTARLVLPHWEKLYPNDNRPRLSIEAAEAVAENDTTETRRAESAARSAWSAARSAESAARSAWSAVWSAADSTAWSAARSAESAAWSAESAAWSVTSAKKEAYVKIIREWLRMVTERSEG